MTNTNKSAKSAPRALAALKRAAKAARELAVRTGTACYVEKDGKIVDIARNGAKKTSLNAAKSGNSKRRPTTKHK